MEVEGTPVPADEPADAKECTERTDSPGAEPVRMEAGGPVTAEEPTGADGTGRRERTDSPNAERVALIAASVLIGVAALVSFVLPMLAGVTAQVGAASAAPLVASAAPPTALRYAEQQTASLQLRVAIPCPGHAQLIINELKTDGGVTDVQFGFLNNFMVTYDASRTNPQAIVSLGVFRQYPATITAGGN